jgi:hypothetical protein
VEGKNRAHILIQNTNERYYSNNYFVLSTKETLSISNVLPACPKGAVFADAGIHGVIFADAKTDYIMLGTNETHVMQGSHGGTPLLLDDHAD